MELAGKVLGPGPLLFAVLLSLWAIVSTPAQALFFGPDSRITPEAISGARPYVAVGQILCKIEGNGWSQEGTGSLTADGIVVTAGHIFLSPNGFLFLYPEACLFLVRDADGEIIASLRPSRSRILTRFFEKIPDRDFALLDVGTEIVRKIQQSMALSTNFQGDVGSPITIVSYSMDIMGSLVRRLVHANIGAKKPGSLYFDLAGIFYHDGDVGPASSGGPILDTASGKLIGIHLGGFVGGVYDGLKAFNYGAYFTREIANEYDIFLRGRGE